MSRHALTSTVFHPFLDEEGSGPGSLEICISLANLEANPNFTDLSEVKTMTDLTKPHSGRAEERWKSMSD